MFPAMSVACGRDGIVPVGQRHRGVVVAPGAVRPGRCVAEHDAVEHDGDQDARLRRPGDRQVVRRGDAVAAAAGFGADAGDTGAGGGCVSMTIVTVDDVGL